MDSPESPARESEELAGRLGTQAALFLVGNVFTLLVGFPLQVFVARKLGAEGLGIFSLIEGAIGILAGLLAFGQAPMLVKFIPHHIERGERQFVRDLVAHSMTLLLVTGCSATVLVLVLFPVIERYWPMLAEHGSAAMMMSLLIPLTLLTFLLQQALRGFHDIRHIVIGSSFVQLTVKALLALVLLGVGFGLMGYVLAVLVSTGVAALWMWIGLRRRLASCAVAPGASPLPSDRLAWRNYARTMYGGSLLGLGSANLDRFVLGAYSGPLSVGVLAVVKQLYVLPVVFLQMFLMVAAPMFASAHARDARTETAHIYHLVTDWVFRLSAPLLVFGLVFAYPILLLFGEHFAAQGVYPLRVMIAGQVLNLAFGPVGSVLYMSGSEKPALRLAVYQAILTTLGLFVLVPNFGLAGAAWVLTSSVVFINLANYRLARGQMLLKWWDSRYRRWLVPLTACVVTAVTISRFGPVDPGPVWLVAYLLALYLVYHALSIARGLHDDDRELLFQLRSRVLTLG